VKEELVSLISEVQNFIIGKVSKKFVIADLPFVECLPKPLVQILGQEVRLDKMLGKGGENPPVTGESQTTNQEYGLGSVKHGVI